MEAFQAICQYHQVLEPFNSDYIPLPVVQAISMSSQTVDHSLWWLRNQPSSGLVMSPAEGSCRQSCPEHASLNPVT